MIEQNIYRPNEERKTARVVELLDPRSLPEAGFQSYEMLANDAPKQKMAFLARTPLETDVDVHTAFVSKKFFRHHCGSFNRHALRRCSPSGEAEARMDRLDEWVFLAQHACFHRFEQEKWLMDLLRILEGFSEEDRPASVSDERPALASVSSIYSAAILSPMVTLPSSRLAIRLSKSPIALASVKPERSVIFAARDRRSWAEL